MLMWGQWVFVLNSWVSSCFCDTVAHDVQMRLCWKCWFEGNESLFLIPESPDAFVTLLPLMFKWNIVGNVDLWLWDHALYSWVSWCFCDAVAPDVQMRHCGKCWFGVMRPCYLFLSLLMLLWCCCPWCSNGTLWEMLIWGYETMFFISESPDDLWRCCTWCSNETLWEMLIWGQWDHVLYFWVSWVFCDLVAPDVQMRLCWKCWFEGNKSLFLIPESPDAFVTLLPLMFQWDIVGNVDLGLWDHVLYFWGLLSLLWPCCTWCSNETLLEMLIWGQWVFVLNSWVFWCFCDTVAPDVQMRLCWKCWFEGNEYLFLIPESLDALVTLLHLISNETLLEMLMWWQWVFVLNSWVSWCFCDTVAPDVEMRLCWKCWFEGNEYLFLIPESWCFCDTVAPDVQMRLCWKCWC